MGRRRADRHAPVTSTKAERRSAPRPATLALLASGLVLAVFVDDRQIGQIGDGRQVIQVAVAIAETGGVGLPRGYEALTLPRPDGDAVTRWGLGMSLAQLPAAFLAPVVESRLGPGSSNSLFLVAPMLLVLAAAGAAGAAAARLGGGPRAAAIAVILVALGSPLGSYAGTDLTEPLQAAAIGTAFAASLAARDAGRGRRALFLAAAAGAAVGVAVLAKTNLVVAAPFALLPLLAWRPAASDAWRRAGAAALGAVPPLAVWAFFEFSRFGGPGRGYGGEGFSHPILDGFVRLIAGPNKGLVLFFPAVVLAGVEAFRRMRPTPPDGAAGPNRAAELLTVAGALLPFVSLLLMASAWWSWDGVSGWGPRLLVPGLAPLGALAAGALVRWSARRSAAFVALSAALNFLPLLQNPAFAYKYTSVVRQVPVDRETAGTFPEAFVVRAADGSPAVMGRYLLPTVPSASDFVLYPWLFSVRLAASPAAAARALENPPWLSARPDMTLVVTPFPEVNLDDVAPAFIVGFLGRSLVSGRRLSRRFACYDPALAFQVLKSQQTRDLERALALAEKLRRIRPGAYPNALLAETYRLMGRPETLSSFIGSLPDRRRALPPVALVVALAARDRGDEETARLALGKAREGYPLPALDRALAAPLSEWPLDLASFLATAGSGPGSGLPRGGEGFRDQ